MNKVLQGLTEENDRLRREAIKSRRETKTTRWHAERRAKVPNNRTGKAPKAALAQREGFEDFNAEKRNNPIIIDNVVLRPPAAQQTKPSKKPDMGITEEQFKTLVKELKEALGIGTPPMKTLAMLRQWEIQRLARNGTGQNSSPKTRETHPSTLIQRTGGNYTMQSWAVKKVDRGPCASITETVTVKREQGLKQTTNGR